MNGMPSENIDELDRRVKALEERCDILRSNYNKLFVETRDLVNEHKKAKAAAKKKAVQRGN